MSQLNTKKTSTFATPPEGSLGFGFDSSGNPCRVNEDGSKTIIPLSDGEGVVTNLIANRGIGLEVDLPSSFVQGDTYITTDTYKVYIANDSINWNQEPLVKSQFITDTSAALALLYQYEGTELIFLTEEVGDLNWLDFEPQDPIPSYLLGRMFYDEPENTWTFFNDIEGISLQLGEELRARLINDTGGDLLDGVAVAIIGGVGASLQVELLDSSDLDSSIRAFGLMTHTVSNGNPGYAVRYGAVRGLDTLGIAVGSIIYGDPDNPGQWSITRPVAPYYPIRIGMCLIESETLGVIVVDTLAFSGSDTSVNIEGILNGIVTQSPQVDISVSGGVIYADVTNEELPAKNLPFILDGIRYFLDTLTGSGPGGEARVVVPPGASSTAKQISFIYIYLNGGVPTLAAATSEPGVPYAMICYLSVFDDIRTAADGQPFAYRLNNNTIDRHDGIHDGAFGLSIEILSAIRSKLGSNWLTGQDATPNVDNSNIKIGLSAGIGAQFRRYSLPLFDGNSYLIYNDDSNQVVYEASTNLTDIVDDANGNTLLSNNTYYTIRIFYQLNSNGVGNYVLATRPLGFYTTLPEAIQDPLNYTVNVNDTDIEEIVYAIYDLVIARTGAGGTTINLGQLTNLRTKLAGGVGGGGAAGGGGTDDKVRVSAADTTNDYLNSKLVVESTTLSKAIQNGGANETLLISLLDEINKLISFKSGVLIDPDETFLPANGINFGDGDTGFYQSSDDAIAILIQTAQRWFIGATEMGSSASNTIRLYRNAATATVPGLRFNGDSDTGIGRAGANQLSLITGGVEGVRIEPDKTKFNQQVIGGDKIESFLAVMIFDFDDGNTQQLTLTGNLTSWTIDNEQPAGSYVVYLIQDATGNRTIPDPIGIDYEGNNSIADFDESADAINIVNIFIMPDGTSIWSLVEIVNP